MNSDVDSILNYLEKSKTKEMIYPSVLQRELKIDIRIIYEVLETCVQTGTVDQYMEIYCPACCHFTGQRFKHIEDVPEKVSCPNCKEEVMYHLKHAVVIYRVL